MFDFDRFISEVIKVYISKKEKAILPSWMENPTPANIRDYAIICLKNELVSEDLNIFQDFFDPEKKFETLEKAIRRIDLGKLRSVQNYLVGNTNEPSEIIVKLTAILIDFKPRPYHKWRAQKLEEGKTNISDCIDQEEISNILKVDTYNVQHQNSKTVNPSETSELSVFSWFSKKSMFSILGCLLVLAIGLITYKKIKNKDCAYWNGEKYIPVDCGEQNIDKEIIHLKDKSLLSLQKITQPDTLTYKDAKKIWYSKINNKIEFFTNPGYHPLNRDKPLKAATIYIINKYATPNSESSNNPGNHNN